MHLLIRYIIALTISIILSLIGLKSDITAVQSVFTVLGIMFSVLMSLIISFNLSQVVNLDIRKTIVGHITDRRNAIIYDFVCSTITLLLSSLRVVADFTISICNHIIFTFPTFAICVLIMSIIYEVRSFMQIHNLQNEIADAIIKEKKGK